MVNTTNLPPSVKKSISQQSGNTSSYSSSSSGGGSGSSSRASSPSSASSEKAVFVSDQYGNLKQVGGAPTVTLTETVGYKKGIQQEYKDYFAAQKEAKSSNTTSNAETTGTYIETATGLGYSMAPSKAAEENARLAAQQKQTAIKTYSDAYNYPYGKETQKVSVSQLKQSQEAAKTSKITPYETKINYPYGQETQKRSVTQLKTLQEASKPKTVPQLITRTIKSEAQEYYNDPSKYARSVMTGFAKYGTTISGGGFYYDTKTNKQRNIWYDAFTGKPDKDIMRAGTAAGLGLSTFLPGVGGVIAYGVGGTLLGVAAGKKYQDLAELISLSPQEKKYKEQYGNAPLKSAFDETQRQMDAKLVYNNMLSNVKSQKETNKEAVIAKADELGLTGTERTDFIKEASMYVEQQQKYDLVSQLQNYGYSKEDADKYAEDLYNEKKMPLSFFEKSVNVPVIGAVSPQSFLYGFTEFAGSKSAFKKGLENYFDKRGITGKKKTELVNLYMKERTVIGGRGITENIFAESFANYLGGGVIKSGMKSISGIKGTVISGKRLIPKLTIQGAKSGLAGGIFEGAFTEFTRQMRRQEKLNTKNVAISGGIGGAIAAGFNAVIVPTAVTKPLVSKATMGVGYAIDFPAEIIGDVVTLAGEKATKYIGRKTGITAGKKAAKEVGIYAMKPPKNLFFVGASPSISSAQSLSTQTTSKKETSVFSDLDAYFNNISLSQENTQKRYNKAVSQSSSLQTQFNQVPAFEPEIERKVGKARPRQISNAFNIMPAYEPSFSPVDNIVPEPIASDNAFDININPSTNIPSFGDVPSFSMVNIPTVTMTPSIRSIPPFALPLGGIEGGGRGGLRRQGVAFRNELVAGERFLTNILSGKTPTLKKKKETTKKKTKKKNKKNKEETKKNTFYNSNAYNVLFGIKSPKKKKR